MFFFTVGFYPDIAPPACWLGRRERHGKSLLSLPPSPMFIQYIGTMHLFGIVNLFYLREREVN